MTRDVTRWNGTCRTVGSVRWRLEHLSVCGTFRLWRCDALAGERIVEHFIAFSPRRTASLEQARAWANGRILGHMRRQVRTLQRQMRAVAS